MVTECRAGDVYLLDFDRLTETDVGLSGVHPVVVLSTRKLNIDRNLVNVVPLVEERPRGERLHAVPLEKEYYWGPAQRPLWAQCAALLSVEIDRLHHSEPSPKTRPGENCTPVPILAKADLKRVRLGVIHVLGAHEVLDHQERRGFKDYVNRVKRLFEARRKGKKRRHGNRPAVGGDEAWG